MTKKCKTCLIDIDLSNAYTRYGQLVNLCKPCNRKIACDYKKRKKNKLLQNNCETCGKQCIRFGARYFCSDKCRFIGYTKKDEAGCWIWTGKSIKQDGYADFGYKNKRVRAHRASYMIFKGEIADGMFILHSCHKPLCVNPDHLREGTVQDNANDDKKSNRQRKGETINTAKLDEQKVKIIRNLYELGNSQQTLANMFGVSQNAISFIVRKVSWKHID